MKRVALALVALSAGLARQAQAQATPVTKVVQLLTDLQAKVTRDGEEAKRLYAEFSAWCEDRAANLGFEIKTGEGEVAQLQATIEQEGAVISTLTTKVDELAGSISSNEASLKAATEIRAKEAADFAAEEKELQEIIDTLKRAAVVLERELHGGTAMLQVKGTNGLLQALNAMVEAATLSSADASRLTALLQASDASTDLGFVQPTAAPYESRSGSIVETVEDLLDKAEAQLEEARKRETAALHQFELLKQSVEDEVKFATRDLDEAKQGIAASGERKAAAEGDLGLTAQELAADKETQATLQHDCTTRAQDYEAETKSREEELKALAEATRVISEATAGAEQISYGSSPASFLQLGRASLTSSSDLAHFEAVRFVRDLARKYKAPALSQLAARMAAATQLGAGAGQDPFAKVKGLISDMIARLEEEAGAEATHKSYCDKELAETAASREEKTATVEKLSTKVDQLTARSAQLKEEVAAAQKALAELAQSQAEQDQLRRKEQRAFVTTKADLQQGLEGIKLGLKVLREYYGKADKAHAAAEGSATGILALLEVVESDFSKNLAEAVASEESAQAEHEQETKENAIEKASKEQDVKYKTSEAASLDKAVAETASDRASVQTQLDAVLEYLKKLEDQCVAKAEPYEERKQRREAEVAGLKQALEILQGEAVLLQQSARRMLRGVRAHVQRA